MEHIVHCNVKENAELIAKILDNDGENKAYNKAHWEKWHPGKAAIIMTGQEYLFECSNCGYKYTNIFNYCPNCGADMRENT